MLNGNLDMGRPLAFQGDANLDLILVGQNSEGRIAPILVDLQRC